MILLDTNVISELMKAEPDPHVVDWLGKQKTIHLGVTSLTIAEIVRGLKRLPTGKRRKDLETRFEGFVQEAFAERVFSFDKEAAYLCGDIAAQRERAGCNTDVVDLMIAAVCRSNEASLATRNTKDFQKCGIKVINPWID